MSSGQNGQVFIKCLKLFSVVFTLFALAGCGSTFKRVQTWEGPSAEPEQVAVLNKPGSIKIISVNGKEMNTYMMDDIELNYELLPGENTVVFSYKTIWGKTTVVDNGESKVNVVETDPQQVVINARAGETYTFVAPEPSTQREAERVVKNFEIPVVDGQNRQVAVSSDFVAPRPELPTLKGAPAQSAAPAVAAGATAGAAARTAGASAQAPAVPSAANNLPTLEGLKVLWERASAEDKKNFLRWAFQ